MFLIRPTEDFDPEQEDWEKAIKASVPQLLDVFSHFASVSFIFLLSSFILYWLCDQVCNKILNLDSNDVTAFHCKVRFKLGISDFKLSISDF